MAKKKRIPSGDSAGITMGGLADALRTAGFEASLSPAAAESPSSPSGTRQASFEPRFRVEKKGRRGKAVTLVEGIDMLDDDARKALAKELGKALGCGATVEDDAILVQGDQCDRLAAHFAAKP
jgi:translation initiation factor 1